LTANERLAEGLAAEVIGVSGSALCFPLVAFQRRKGLCVVGDVGSSTSEALALESQSCLITAVD